MTFEQQSVRIAWRAPVSDDELVELTRSHGGRPEAGWWDRVRQHSLGWVTARAGEAGQLVGFVNVAWDGGHHAFLIDTKTRPTHQRQGLATAVVERATAEAQAAGCEWLFVDFEPALAAFYVDACGFRGTAAGLIHLPDWQVGPPRAIDPARSRSRPTSTVPRRSASEEGKGPRPYERGSAGG